MDAKLNILYQKLDKFIFRYHLYKIIKGILIFIALFLFIFLLQTVIEYFNYLRPGVKFVLFYLTLFLTLLLFVYYFLLPLLSLLKLRKRISYRKASGFIATHFPEIKDKLLNTLELLESNRDATSSFELVLASINQRINGLSVFKFQQAINYNQLKKNFLFFTSSVFILALIYSFNPDIIVKGSNRFVHYSRYYEPEAPFKFLLRNALMDCEKNKDFRVELSIQGEYLPENVYINIGQNSFLMNKSKFRNEFSFTIKNVNNTFDFYFTADGYRSRDYTLNVLPSPVLKSFVIEVQPPPYTNLANQRFENSGDLVVPSGSFIKWSFNTLYVSSVHLRFTSDTVRVEKSENYFDFSRRISETLNYSIFYQNEHFNSGDNLNFSIRVIPDEFPEISVYQMDDSVKLGAFYFLIALRDDYGFHDLKFVRKTKLPGSSDEDVKTEISINPIQKSQELGFYFDFTEIQNLHEGVHLEYYFEIRDNDALNGFKTSRSSSLVFKVPSREDIRTSSSEIEEERNKALLKSKDLSGDIKKEIEDFKKKELNNELSEWDKKNFLKSITEKQKEIDEFIENALENNKKGNQLDNQFYKENKSLIEKQNQIQELLDKIVDEELKKLLEEIKSLSEKFNSAEFDKMREKMDFSYKNLEKKLDRSLELLKRYEIEENVLKTAEDLKNLSDKQEQFSNENQKEFSKQDLNDKQDKISKEFENIKNEFKETIKKNDDLKSPFEMNEFNDGFEKIEESLEELEKEIQNDSRRKLPQKQKDVSKSMEEMSESMKNLFNQMEMKTIEMNLEDLRQLIDNISLFSQAQEENYTDLNKTLQNSPAYKKLLAEQIKISGDFIIIEDSLRSLMTKVPQLNELVFKEIESSLFNLEKTKSLLETRNRREALKFQRFVITSANTLMLLLDELKDQIENQKQSGQGGGKSKKGKAEESMQSLKKQQQKLKEQLEKLLQELNQNNGKPEGQGMNDQIVKTLAEQEIFNEMLKQLQNEKGIIPETDKILKEIKRLSDQNINDLINKNISPELFNRNQKILSRLLESEKAEKEREQENKRESNEGVKKDMLIPEKLRETLKKEQKLNETLQKGTLNMKNYFKNLSNDYFRILNN